QSGRSPTWLEDKLGRQRRPGHDVSGRLSEPLLSRAAGCAARGGRGLPRAGAERVVAGGGNARKDVRHRQPHTSMDLLLTHGYFLYEDLKELQIMKPYAPLGILYLSSHLRAKGFGVEVYDSTFGSREELFRILANGPPAILGISGNLMTRRNALDILEAAKAAGWKVVLGGPE